MKMKSTILMSQLAPLVLAVFFGLISFMPNEILGQTTIFSEDFEGSPIITSETTTDPIYQSTTNVLCNVSNRWAVGTPFSWFNCTACSTTAATIDESFSSNCNNTYEDYRLHYGTFTTSQSSLIVKFDWGLYDSDFAPWCTLTAQLWNKTDGIQEGVDLISVSSSSATLGGSYNQTLTVTPSKDYELRFIWDTENLSYDAGVNGGDQGAAIDNIIVQEICNPPAFSATTNADCGNAQFHIDVNITNLGTAGQVDISNDAGVATTTGITTTGNVQIGPFAAGTDVIVTVDGTPYTGCAALPSGTLSEACSCVSNPTATVNALNLNCTALTYDIQVTVDSDGSGDMDKTDILIDGVVVQADAVTGQMYTLSVAQGAHIVTVEAEGASFVTCISSDYNTSLYCNGANTCANANSYDLLSDCQSGSFADPSITASGLFTDPAGSGYMNNGACSGLGLMGDYVTDCSAGTSSYSTVSTLDIWYEADLPTGVNSLTLNITGLMGDEMLAIILYENGCTNFDDVYPGNTPISSQCNFIFSSTITSQTITGLTDGALYNVRVLPVGKNGESCANIPLPASFTICTPPSNDICGNASDINAITQSGNLCNASTDAENTETCNVGNNCTACTVGNESNDLWYKVEFTGADQVLSVDITFPNATDEVLVSLYSSCNTNSLERYGPFGSEIPDCAAVTSTGAGSTVTHTFGSVLNAGDYYVRVSPTTGNSVCGFDILGTLKLENDDCELFNQTLPIGYNISTGSSPVNMTLATASDATGEFAGMKDLWYNINNNSNHQMINISMSDLGNWSGEMMLVLYEYPSSATLDCDNLVEHCRHNVTSTIDIELYNDITSMPYSPFSFTDILNADDGVMMYLKDGEFLLRVIETVPDAGGDQINVTMSGLLSTTFDPIASNSECSGAIALPATNQDMDDAGAACADYAETDCDGNGYTTWSPVSFEEEYFKGPGKDLWYSFNIPATSCPTSLSSLETSTVISGATISVTNFLTDGGSNAIAEVELHQATCGNRIECRDLTTIGGAGSVTFTGLDQDETYYVRLLRKGSNHPEQLFDISSTLDYVSPCNDKKEDAYELTVNDCPDYTSLLTFSALGANAEIPGERTVWFKFVAPDPGNGGPYFNPYKSWVTVFLEGVSGHNIEMHLFEDGGTTQANGANPYQVNSAGDRVWGKFGNLEPGSTYFIRLQHNETATTDVTYKIEVNAEGDVTPLSCGANPNWGAARLCGSCGDVPLQVAQTTQTTTETLCEEWYKVDLPPGTPGNMFWLVEVRGFDQVLDFELRSQHITETSANVGGEDDYDHPCTSRPLEPSASIVSSTTVDYQVTAGGVYSYVGGEVGSSSCEDITGTAPYGGGYKKIYQNLNGHTWLPFTKDYYYIRVFMDEDDPQFANCEMNGGINVCEVVFKGPYLTAADASTDTNLDDRFCTLFDYCDLSSDIYEPSFAFYADSLDINGNPNPDGLPDDGVWLGNTIDAENDSWGMGDAVSDDTVGDDEDGLDIIVAAKANQDCLIRTTGNAEHAGTTVFNGLWIDWGTGGLADGTTDDFSLNSGVTASPVDMYHTFAVPSGYVNGDEVFMRLMASKTAIASGDFNARVENGEVEGHKFTPPLGLISGMAFLDATVDGISTGDAVIEGITVTLTYCGRDGICGNSDDGTVTTTTDINGEYDFEGVADGNFTITFGTNDGTTTYTGFTTQDTGADGIDSDVNSGGTTNTITITGGSSATNVDAGLLTDNLISGTVFLDNYADGTEANLNGDGTGTDAGLVGVTVTLVDCGIDGICGGANAADDGASIVKMTDSNGNYLFDKLPDGNYQVSFSKSDASQSYDTFTDRNIGADTTIDSDADPSTGFSPVYTLGGATRAVTNVDAGLYDYITIEGTLYTDQTFTTIAPNQGSTITITYCDDPTCATTTDVPVSITSDGAGGFTIDNTNQLLPGIIAAINSSYGNIEGGSVINTNTNAPSGESILLQNFALPVELLSFRGEALDRINRLEWITATEENSAWFMIERSSEMNNGFKEIGRLEAAGNSAVELKYLFDDTDPVSKAYYRLKILDLDGSFDYSNTILIQRAFDGIRFQGISPVPSKGKFNLAFGTKSGIEIEILLTDTNGKLIEKRTLLSEEENRLSFDLSNYPNGVYFITISNDTDRVTEKLIIAR